MTLDNVVIIQNDDMWDPRRKKYFHPRFIRVLPGQEIRWINHDTKNHRLVSGNPDALISDGIFDTGEILVGNASSIQFNSSQGAKSIHYFCFLPSSERGTVVILPIEEDALTNEERLELLESTFAYENYSGNQENAHKPRKIC